MNYIGNCQEFILPEFIDVVLKTNGDTRPSIQELDQSYKLETIKKWEEAGYDLSKLKWTMYYQSHFSKTLKLPPMFQGNIQWWFVKLNPGDIFPCHLDLFENKKNVKRYWIACQDYKLGHVFVYENRMLTEYRAGDIFEIDPNVYHGSVNIGFVPKISLQISISE